MQLTSQILDDYKQITGRDISLYFSNTVDFFNGDYLTIVNYFSGKTSTISSIPFKNFDTIEKQNQDVFETWHKHSKQFNNVKWWLLIEQIEEIDNRLKTLRNINKWARSSITKVAYNPTFQLDYTLKQNETLESVAANVVGSDNPNDDWADIAISNRLNEEDYSASGGNDLKLSFNRINGSFAINAVVDVMVGKSVYGMDLNKSFGFDSTTNDLKVLSYDDTILQAAGILYNLKKNDNPDNPNAGLQTNLVIGQNRALFNFPVIIRQKTQAFANDDTFKNLKINNLNIDQDNVFTDYTVETRLNEVIANGSF